MRVCIWCYANFQPRADDSPNTYQLPSAGTQICWGCADKYEDSLIGLHFDKLNCYWKDGVVTQNGYPLSITMEDWHRPSTRWGHSFAYGVDSSGKHWKAVQKHDLLQLKPV